MGLKKKKLFLQVSVCRFGTVMSVIVCRDHDTGMGKGFGFVVMADCESSKKVFCLLSSFPSFSQNCQIHSTASGIAAPCSTLSAVPKTSEIVFNKVGELLLGLVDPTLRIWFNFKHVQI